MPGQDALEEKPAPGGSTPPGDGRSPIGQFPFDHERATYFAHKAELLRREGEYVVIRGEEIAGIVDDLDEAVGLGYERFGAGGFMIRQVLTVEPVVAFPRAVEWPS